MKAVHLVALSTLPMGTINRLASMLSGHLEVPCLIDPADFDPAFAFDGTRGQHYSTAILARMASTWTSPDRVRLAITDHDLYVPILTYVFGEAQLPGSSAIVSGHRLHEEFYGLPGSLLKWEERLLKESVHELGHTQGLRHCEDWRCVMASAHDVEALDLKSSKFCSSCTERFLTRANAA